jgi:hypothetical protein
MYNNCVQHLIAPFLVFLKWLRVRKVLANMAVIGLTWVFSYSTNVVVDFRLITPIKLGNNMRP